jgi:hypothetical protein
MGVPSKGALICDIKADLADIVCDTQTIAKITCDLLHTCNPCAIQADLKAIACIEKDLACDYADLNCDLHELSCVYHCNYVS